MCGTDGITYKNQCILDRVTCKTKGAVTKAEDGKCCKDRCSKVDCGPRRTCVWDPLKCKANCRKLRNDKFILIVCMYLFLYS